jgi:hypothetical protein
VNIFHHHNINVINRHHDKEYGGKERERGRKWGRQGEREVNRCRERQSKVFMYIQQ